MPRVRYEPWKPGQDALGVIAKANAVCADYRRQGYDLTLRQLYYQFVARGWIPNAQRSYKRLGDIVNKARMAGLMDWNYIIDRTRNLQSIGRAVLRLVSPLRAEAPRGRLPHPALSVQGRRVTYSDVDDHEPGPVDGEGHVRCSACGFRHPCPTVRAQPRRLDQDEVDVLLALDIGIGFSIYRRQPEGADADPIGGTVVGAWDDQDGRRTFRVVDFPRGRRRIHVIRLDEVEPATVGLPNAALCRSQARKLAEHVGRQKGLATGEELEVLADAITLFQAIA